MFGNRVKDKVNNVHDKGYKYLLSNKKAFAEFIKNFIDKEWVKDISEDDLILVDKSYISSEFKEKEADIVYKAKTKNKEIIFYVLLELQSTVDYQMPIRLLLYMVEIWKNVLKDTEDKIKRRKDFRLPAIIPIVLYNGKNKWTACRSFK